MSSYKTGQEDWASLNGEVECELWLCGCVADISRFNLVGKQQTLGSWTPGGA